MEMKINRRIQKDLNDLGLAFANPNFLPSEGVPRYVPRHLRCVELELARARWPMPNFGPLVHKSKARKSPGSKIALNVRLHVIICVTNRPEVSYYESPSSWPNWKVLMATHRLR